MRHEQQKFSRHLGMQILTWSDPFWRLLHRSCVARETNDANSWLVFDLTSAEGETFQLTNFAVSFHFQFKTKAYKSTPKGFKSIKLHLVKWFQEGHSRCLWIFLQTCPPGHSVRLWESPKTTVYVLQYDTQANFVWSCLNKSPGDHLNMREVTSAIPDILQRTAPSCMRPMYHDVLLGLMSRSV